jgi:NTE family protein
MIETQKNYTPKKISSASVNAAVFGVPKIFTPRWWKWVMHTRIKKISSTQKIGRTCMIHSPLAKTLHKYIDYKKLNRAVISEVDVMTARPLLFDSFPREYSRMYGFPIAI